MMGPLFQVMLNNREINQIIRNGVKRRGWLMGGLRPKFIGFIIGPQVLKAGRQGTPSLASKD